jgi:hypothetical protein
MNGLGTTGWRSLSDSLRNDAALQGLAVGGDFGAELEALKSTVRPTDTIVSVDGRLPFYYGSQAVVFGPQTCRQPRRPAGQSSWCSRATRSRRSTVRRQAPSTGGTADRPGPTMVTERPGAFALFTVGA